MIQFGTVKPGTPPGHRRPLPHRRALSQRRTNRLYGELFAVDVWNRAARNHCALEHDFKNRAGDSRHFFRRVVGNHPAEMVDVPANAETERELSRSVPEE